MMRASYSNDENKENMGGGVGGPVFAGTYSRSCASVAAASKKEPRAPLRDITNEAAAVSARFTV